MSKSSIDLLENRNGNFSRSIYNLNQYLKNVPVLSVQEQHELVRRAKNGDLEARNKLVETNIRLVLKAAFYYGKKVPTFFQDLIQEGIIGLIKAVEKFDETQNVKFATYAYWWIRNRINRFIKQHTRTIQVPVNVLDDIKKLKKTYNNIAQTGEEPTAKKLAEALDWPIQKIDKLLALTQEPLPLDKTVGKDEDTELSELLKVPTMYTPENIVLTNEQTDLVHQAIKQLTQREQEVICSRYGLDGSDSQTLHNIAEKFGVSRERIRQIENQALAKMRRTKHLQKVM